MANNNNVINLICTKTLNIENILNLTGSSVNITNSENNSQKTLEVGSGNVELIETVREEIINDQGVSIKILKNEQSLRGLNKNGTGVPILVTPSIAKYLCLHSNLYDGPVLSWTEDNQLIYYTTTNLESASSSQSNYQSYCLIA